MSHWKQKNSKKKDEVDSISFPFRNDDDNLSIATFIYDTSD